MPPSGLWASKRPGMARRKRCRHGWRHKREQFLEVFATRRIATLREKIAIHHPRAVVFYFWRHREYPEAIAGGEFRHLIPEKLLGLERNGTAYFITGHPAARNLADPDAYFAALGQYFSRDSAEL